MVLMLREPQHEIKLQLYKQPPISCSLMLRDFDYKAFLQQLLIYNGKMVYENCAQQLQRLAYYKGCIESLVKS